MDKADKADKVIGFSYSTDGELGPIVHLSMRVASMAEALDVLQRATAQAEQARVRIEQKISAAFDAERIGREFDRAANGAANAMAPLTPAEEAEVFGQVREAAKMPPLPGAAEERIKSSPAAMALLGGEEGEVFDHTDPMPPSPTPEAEPATPVSQPVAAERVRRKRAARVASSPAPPGHISESQRPVPAVNAAAGQVAAAVADAATLAPTPAPTASPPPSDPFPLGADVAIDAGESDGGDEAGETEAKFIAAMGKEPSFTQLVKAVCKAAKELGDFPPPSEVAGWFIKHADKLAGCSGRTPEKLAVDTGTAMQTYHIGSYDPIAPKDAPAASA